MKNWNDVPDGYTVERIGGADCAVYRYEDGTYFAKVLNRPGCMTKANTRVELEAMIASAIAEWDEVAK